MSIKTVQSSHRWTLQTHGDRPGLTCTCGELIEDWEHQEPDEFREGGGEAFSAHLTAVGEPALEGHRLELSHDGDGWVEPFHESLSCTCRLEIGSWTQKDQDHSDYPAWTTFLAGPAGVVFAHHLIEVRQRDAVLGKVTLRGLSHSRQYAPIIQSPGQLGLEVSSEPADRPTTIRFPARD